MHGESGHGQGLRETTKESRPPTTSPVPTLITVLSRHLSHVSDTISSLGTATGSVDDMLGDAEAPVLTLAGGKGERLNDTGSHCLVCSEGT